jgi:site-specific recombinase XerD
VTAATLARPTDTKPTTRRAEPPVPDTLTAAELDRLFAAVTGRSKTAIRNRALLMVLHDAALRSSEAVALRPGDVDVLAGDVNVRKAKGRRARLVRDCLDPATRQAVSEWMTLRELLGWDGRSAVLFGTFYERPERASGGNRTEAKGGTPLDTSYLRRLLPDLADKAGIGKDVSPHLLRHSRARQWSDRGVPTADIQHSLGHKSLATTSIYLARIAPAGMGAGEHGRAALDAHAMMDLRGQK